MRNDRASRWGLWLAGLLIAASMAPAAPPLQVPQPTSPKKNADAIRATVQTKIKVATSLLEQAFEALKAPPVGNNGLAGQQTEPLDQIYYWSRRLTDAKLEAAENREARVKVLTEELDLAKKYEALLKDLEGGGGRTGQDLEKATYYRADTEGRLLREQE